MFETAFTLGLTQFARTLSFPERLQHRAARNGVLEPWRARNTSLDSLFYDVSRLTAEEIFYVSDAIAAEGLILIVPPSGGPMLTVCDSVDEYRQRGGRDVHALAVAGIGGSAIGAAAFARNVADALDQPVAAVVSGYGIGDIVSEAFGAGFLFGRLGNIRGSCETIDDVLGRPHFGAYDEAREAGIAARRERGEVAICLDVETVASLLDDETLRFDLLAGHSRGNLVLSEALGQLAETSPSRLATLARDARLVTFGARLGPRPDFPPTTNLIGDLDWYGELNSAPRDEREIRLAFCGHSTNTGMPGAMNVTALLRELLAASPAPRGEEPMPAFAPEVSDLSDETQPAPVALAHDEMAPAEPILAEPPAPARKPGRRKTEKT